MVALLEAEDDAWVRSLWTRLADEVGVRGVFSCPHPHMSYLGATHVTEDELTASDAVLAQLARGLPPIETRVTGVATFSGEKPVVYLGVEPTAALRAQHERVWAVMEGGGVLRDANPLYRPESWVPHITLVFGDARERHLGAIADVLDSTYGARLNSTVFPLHFVPGSPRPGDAPHSAGSSTRRVGKGLEAVAS